MDCLKRGSIDRSRRCHSGLEREAEAQSSIKIVPAVLACDESIRSRSRHDDGGGLSLAFGRSRSDSTSVCGSDLDLRKCINHSSKSKQSNALACVIDLCTTMLAGTFSP
jgi:hypothetical protein